MVRSNGPTHTGCARSGDVPVTKMEEMIIGGARSKREGAGPEFFWIERCLLHGLLDCPWFGTCREVPQDVGKRKKVGTRSTNTPMVLPSLFVLSQRTKPTHANARSEKHTVRPDALFLAGELWFVILRSSSRLFSLWIHAKQCEAQAPASGKCRDSYLNSLISPTFHHLTFLRPSSPFILYPP